MNITQIKIFEDRNYYEVQLKVNKFINDLASENTYINIKDIKFIPYTIRQESGVDFEYYTAMVIYEI